MLSMAQHASMRMAIARGCRARWKQVSAGTHTAHVAVATSVLLSCSAVLQRRFTLYGML